MARCGCFPTLDKIEGHTSSRELVLRQLSSSSSKSKKSRKRRFNVFIEECRFELVRRVFLDCGGVEVGCNCPWILAWADGVIPMERFTRMKPYQKINHFPGMGEICKKDLLAINLKRMKKVFPKEYNFFPITFRLPDEDRLLHKYCQKMKRDFFIIKPDKNCQGSGIEIVKGMNGGKKYKDVVCQKYIVNPLLMDGYKLDLRLYVFITSVSPLRVYVYKEGLVRLATVPYKKPSASNLHEKRMHLTNYAINRSKENVAQKKMGTCKRSLTDLEEHLDSLGIDRSALWPTVDSMIVKTILSALPNLRHLFHASFPIPPAISPCFEILGFDVLLSDKAKPYLLEVNRSPSLGGSTTMDKDLKRGLVQNAIEMVLPTRRQIALLADEQHLKAVRRLVNLNISKHPSAKERIVAEYQEQREKKKMGNFRLIYPAEDDRHEAILRAAMQLSGIAERGGPTHSSD